MNESNAEPASNTGAPSRAPSQIIVADGPDDRVVGGGMLIATLATAAIGACVSGAEAHDVRFEAPAINAGLEAQPGMGAEPMTATIETDGLIQTCEATGIALLHALREADAQQISSARVEVRSDSGDMQAVLRG